MPSKLTGDATLAHTSLHTYIHICTYFLTDELKRWNLRTQIHITRRGQYIDEQRWKAPVSVRPLSSQLYLHSRVAFATLYTLHRTIICIPGANTPPTLTERALQYTFASQHHVPPFFLSLFHRILHLRPTSFFLPLERARLEQTMVMVKQRGSPLKMRLMQPSTQNGGSLLRVLCPFFCFCPLPFALTRKIGVTTR